MIFKLYKKIRISQVIDLKIIRFIKRHHVLTIATSNNNEPYCANCFYVYLEDENCFIFTSDRVTKHIEDAMNQKLVAGSVVLETKIIGKIRGLQFQGVITEMNGDLEEKANKVYHKRFPYAALMQTTLWKVDLTFIKFTDNRLGFGEKIIWRKQ